MPITEAKKKANRKYEAAKRCKLTIDMTPAQRDQINEFCQTRGGTGTHIKRLIRDDMRANGIEPIGVDENKETEMTL